MTHTEDTMQFSQDELRQFVGNEVYLNQSHLVEHLLSEGVFEYDEIENLYRTPDMDECSFTVNLEAEEENDGTTTNTMLVVCEYDGAEGEARIDVTSYQGAMTEEQFRNRALFKELGGFDSMREEAYEDMLSRYDIQEPQEIYEWWAVSPTLLRELAEQGEPVLRTDYGSWWGRTTTGQAIFLDSVITDVKSALRSKVDALTA